MLFFDFYRWRGNEARIIQMIRQKISRYRRSISFWHRVEMASWNNSLELRLFKWKWTDFIYDNHWPELYYLLNLFSAIVGKAFISEFFFFHLDAKQLNRVTSVMWLYSHAQWQMSINNWLNHCIRMMFFIYITPIIEGYFIEENRNTTISDQG